MRGCNKNRSQREFLDHESGAFRRGLDCTTCLDLPSGLFLSLSYLALRSYFFESSRGRSVLFVPYKTDIIPALLPPTLAKLSGIQVSDNKGRKAQLQPHYPTH